MSGLVSIAAGLLVRLAGRNAVEKILPPTITGPVAMIIGLTLAGNALTDAAPRRWLRERRRRLPIQAGYGWFLYRRCFQPFYLRAI